MKDNLVCFQHEHNMETGELLWTCSEPAMWTINEKEYPHLVGFALCDTHYKERGENTGNVVKVYRISEEETE